MPTDTNVLDITAFRLLSESNPFLLQFLEFSPDATLILNSQRIILFANSQAQEMFGFKEEQLVGSALNLLIPERFHEVHEQHERQYLKNPVRRPMGRERHLEFIARRRDNSEFPIDISLSPLKTAESTWIAAAIRDVTRQKQAERQIQQYAGELKRSNEELASFAHVAAHDLGAPLRRVGMVSQMIQDDYAGELDENAKKLFDMLIRSVNQMEDLIRELLAHSKVGAQNLNLQPVDVNGLLDQILLEFSDTIEEHGIGIQRGDLPTVSGDRVSLVRLFQNLINNAILYRSEQPLEISIDAVKRGAMLEFEVKDNGIGIDRKNHDVIFQIFRRLGNDGIPGTGIGLATCKKIVELHGGRIWVDSALQQGSTFRFTLPVEPSSGKSQPRGN